MTLEVILLDGTQVAWINNYNSINDNKAVICDYGLGFCLDASVMTLDGYEDVATYLSGSTITEVEINSPI